MKNININTDILCAEYHRIVPPEYHPDLEIQANKKILPRSYVLHEEWLRIVEDLGVVVSANDTNKACIKTISAYHVLLTDALLHKIPKLPKPQRDIVCGFGDRSEFREYFGGSMRQMYFSLTPNLTPESIDEIWEGIKTAYGPEYAPTDAAIFENMRLYVLADDVGEPSQRFMRIAAHKHPNIVEKLQQRLPCRKEPVFIFKQ